MSGGGIRPYAVRASLALIILLGGRHSYAQSPSMVVVYSSEDRQCDEPILRDFEKDTGIHVEAVYDKEAAEVVMKRLVGERNDPQADVYWANEPVHPDTLKAMGITQPYVSPNAAAFPAMFKDPQGHWTAFSARARVLVVNARSSAKAESILAYADPKWAGKAVLANPLLNTTSFNLTALFNLWGDERAWQFLDNVKRNGFKMASGNGESALMVASGQAEFSLVDVDDALQAARSAPKGVELRYPDQGGDGLGSFMVANTLAMIRGARHPDDARKLIDYLLTAETQRKLAFSACAQTPLTRGVEVPPTVKRIEELRVMKVNYSDIRTKLEEIRPRLKAWSGQ